MKPALVGVVIGRRVLVGLRKQFARLRLKVNEDKAAVTCALGRKFLGFSFWAAPGGVVKRSVAAKALQTFKQGVRWLTRRRSLTQVIERLRAYVLGWKAYFGLSQTPGVFRHLDEWLRHRLRAIQVKHWKRGKTMYRELRVLGACPEQARRVAANSRRGWRNSRYELNCLMPIANFEALGLSRLG